MQCMLKGKFEGGSLSHGRILIKNDAECVTKQVTDSVTSQTKWLLCIGFYGDALLGACAAVSPSADTCHWFKGIKEECM